MVAKSDGPRNDRLWHGTVDRPQHRSKKNDPRTAVPVIVHGTRVFSGCSVCKAKFHSPRGIELVRRAAEISQNINGL